MSTTTNASFDSMLRSYAPNELFRDELFKSDWLLTNVEKDETWLGDAIEVRFKSATASSIQFGGLTSDTDISQSQFVKGSITNQPEVWGSLIFNHKDLMRHGKINEQNFLKILPDEIDDFTSFMKSALSLNFLNGTKVVSFTDATNAATGVMVVDRIERLYLGQKFQLVDNVPTASVAVYVTNIDVNKNLVTLSLTRGGAAADVSAWTVAHKAGLAFDGQQTSANQLTCLKDALLSLANGGSAQLYGQNKIAAPFMQAINVDGSTITSTNILDQLFDAQTTVRNKGKGNPDTLICSYKHLGTILKRLEAVKGPFRQASEMKASQYGWSEVEVMGVKGKFTLVAIQEMNDDVIFILDKKAMKVYSNGGIQKRANPDGREYYEVRNSSGFYYIVDIAFMGDLVLERPSRCGIIFGISYT